MPTQSGETIEVTLECIVQKEKTKVVADPPLPVLKEGNSITFKTPNGGTLDLLLSPKDAFVTHTFKTGDKPVHVTKSGKATVWCGGTFHGDYEKPIIIRPAPGHFGVHSEDGP
jgi:hypothetical protein